MCGVWWKNSLTVYVCCQSCQDALSVLLKTKPFIYLSSDIADVKPCMCMSVYT